MNHGDGDKHGEAASRTALREARGFLLRAWEWSGQGALGSIAKIIAAVDAEISGAPVAVSHVATTDDPKPLNGERCARIYDEAKAVARAETPCEADYRLHETALVHVYAAGQRSVARSSTAAPVGFPYKMILKFDGFERVVEGVYAPPSAIAATAKTGPVYLLDGKPHRLCDCDTMKGDCPRGNERQLQTTQLSRCLVPAEGVLIVGGAP